MNKKLLTRFLVMIMSLIVMASIFVLPASAATSISKAVVTYETTHTYTGKAIKPSVTVKVGSKKLTTKSYTVSYKNNKSVGKATLTITGKGSYTGKISKSFYIQPKKVASLKATPYSTKIKLSWGKVTGAKAYQVYQYIGGKWTKLDNTTSRSFTVTGLKPVTTYKFRVRAYAKTGSKTLYSPSYTSISATTTIGKPTKISASSIKETSIDLKWSAVTSASKYQLLLINEVTDKKTTYETTETSMSLTNLSSFTDYTVKIRAYNKSKDITGNYSDYFAFKTAPHAVSSFKATASGTSVSLSWKKIDDVVGYQLYVNEYDESGNPTSYKKVATVSGTSYTLDDLSVCRYYAFRIRAYDKASTGTIYSEYTTTKPLFIGLSPVENFKVSSATNKSITVSWSKAAGVTGYRLYLNDKLTATVDSSKTSYTFDALAEDTEYTVSIATYLDGYKSENVSLTTKTTSKKVTGVEFLSTNPKTLAPGETGTIKAQVIPSYATNKNITYTSLNKSVATIDNNGRVTAIAPGKVTITAKTEEGGFTAYYVLTVETIKSTSISIPSAITLSAGESTTIKPTFKPDDTTDKTFTIIPGPDHTYTYKGGFLGLESKTETCKFSDYIYVNSAGLIRGIKATVEPQTGNPFSFTVTVKANDSGKTATATVTVSKKMVSVAYIGDDSPWFYGNSARLSVTLDSSISSNYKATDLRWKSSDTSVATVSADGTVKCVGVGQTTITVTTSDNKYSGSYTLYSRSIVVINKSYYQNCKVGDTYKIDAQIKPSSSTETLAYRSTNSAVASVNASGLVTIHGTGSATIMVYTNVDSFNYEEVLFTSGTWTKPTGTKAQLYTLIKDAANSVKTADNLPGFTRNDATYFDNFTISASAQGLTADDLYSMFADLAAPKSFVQDPVYAGSSDYTQACQEYMLNVPVREQNLTILEGLDVNKDIKSIEVIDNGSYTYDIKMTLNDEYIAALPSSSLNYAHGQVFDILTRSYISLFLDEINNSGSMKVNYNSFSQKYHDSSITVSIDKATGKVSDMKYDMNIAVTVTGLEMTYSFITYKADITFDCNNVTTFDFYGYKD